MTTLGIIAMLVAVFIIGAFVGIILISMCMSNDRYDNDQASYELGVKNGILKGRAEMRLEMEGLCSHCAYYGRKDNG